MTSGKPDLPGVHRQRRSPLWARLCLVFGLVLSLGAGGTLVAFELVKNKVEGSITQRDLLGRGEPENQARREVDGPLNILLAGLDYRKDDPESQKFQRADSIMWVHIPRDHKSAYILSIPRDLRVEIPAFAPSKFGGRTEKINEAFGDGMGNGKGREGGMQLLVKTVEQVTGARFDMAGIIDWYGFTGITGELGGVTMCLDTPIKSHHSDYTFPKGCQHYNGHRGLELVRQRYDVPGGDYGRQKLQQQFVKQILKQAMGKDVLTNPVKLNALVKTVGDSLVLDKGGYELSDLVWSLKGITPENIIPMQVPHKSLKINGTDYESLEQPRASELFKAMADERIDSFLVANTDLTSKLPG
ncbi:LCP family protein [Longispora albida]|uniref:LCP family protein n=1 Tax=Longispora albida TaxID=203523 RepID=UPI00038148D7|nr:LCP family protein [Longispora albida]